MMKKAYVYSACGVVLLVVVVFLGWRGFSSSFTQVHMNPDSLNERPGLAKSTHVPASLLEATPTQIRPSQSPNTQTDNLSSPASSGVQIEYSLTPPYRTSTVSSNAQRNYSTSPPYRRLPTSNKNSTGYLNYDVWHWIVGYLVDDMRIVREFPLHPDDRGAISHLHVKFDESDRDDLRGRYGHKIYGYITPPELGSYSFRVELTEMTAAAEVELWISTTSDPLNMTLILELLYDDGSRPVKRVATTKSKESDKVELGSGSYYFEFLQKAFEGSIVADVKWKTPSSTSYVPVPSSCFTMAAKLNDQDHYAPGQSVQFLLNGSLPSNSHMTHYRVDSVILPITDLKVLPDCEYKSLYAQPHKVGNKKGFYEVRQSNVYPKDKTWHRNWKKSDGGSKVMNTQVMENVINLYSKALHTSMGANATAKLRHMEETPNKNDGSRFLLEMDVQLHQPTEETVHTSEYVYLKKGSSQLCHTSNFQWTKDAFVHLIVSVKNLGQWVRHLIYNMEDIHVQTGDERFDLIIVDYRSADMDIEQEAKKSLFKRITVLHKEGAFSRAGGLQEAINHVKDGNDIIIAIDLHLTLPKGFLEYVRKRTVQHKMAFTPMFFKLNKGYTEINYNGAWGLYTYGTFSMYKSDWTKAGGFDTVRYTTKWGDEDWSMLDRSLRKGMEAYRIRPPGYIHYHHSKKGMWGNSDVNFKDQHWTIYS